MEHLLRDLRTAARTLRRSAGFTGVVVLTLALGIGANTAVFSVVSAVLITPLPYREADRLVMIWETFPQIAPQYVPLTEGSFVDYTNRNDVLASYSGFRIRSLDNNLPVTVTTPSAPPLAVNGVTCGANLFETLGVPPFMGRFFNESESKPGAPPVVVVSHGYWLRNLGADPAAIGRSVIMDGTAREVVGVLPPGFFFPPPLRIMGTVRQGAADLFYPYVFDPDSRYRHTIRSVARLRDDVSLEQAKANLDRVAAQLVQEHKDYNPEGLAVVLLPLHGQAVSDSRALLLILMSAVGVILLIACVNVANLFLARTFSRRREMAIRVALGARKRDIIRQLLCESLLLSSIGGALGLALASVGLKALVALISTHVPQLGPITIDADVLVFTVVISLLTGLIFGLTPAVQATRPKLNEGLREGERGNAPGGRDTLRKALVIAEVSMAFVLLIGAGLLLRSLWQLQRTDPGFDYENVVTVSVLPPESRYPEPQQVTAFFERLMEEMQTLPGVEGVGAVSQLPLSGGLLGGYFDIVGRDSATREEDASLNATYRVIGGDFLETLHIPLAKGRKFDGGDRADARRVALIDRALADLGWPNQDPLSSLIRVDEDGPLFSIVGIVDNIHGLDLRTEGEGVIYFPLAQRPTRAMNLAIRTPLPPESLVSAVQERMRRIDSEIAVRVDTLDSNIVNAQAGLRVPATLFVSFAALAVLLATIGLYGLMSYLVGQKRKEIGIRLALGAERSDIIRRIGLQTGAVILAGIVIGLAVSLLLSRLLGGLLFGVTPTDPLTYAGVALLLVLTAGVSGYLPARRASLVDPNEALRTE